MEVIVAILSLATCLRCLVRVEFFQDLGALYDRKALCSKKIYRANLIQGIEVRLVEAAGLVLLTVSGGPDERLKAGLLLEIGSTAGIGFSYIISVHAGGSS